MKKTAFDFLLEKVTQCFNENVSFALTQDIFIWEIYNNGHKHLYGVAREEGQLPCSYATTPVDSIIKALDLLMEDIKAKDYVTGEHHDLSTIKINTGDDDCCHNSILEVFQDALMWEENQEKKKQFSVVQDN